MSLMKLFITLSLNMALQVPICWLINKSLYWCKFKISFIKKLTTVQGAPVTTNLQSCTGVIHCVWVFISVSVDEESSLKKSELINWYLKELESEIDSEAELIAKKSLIERVIHRLVHYVRNISAPWTVSKFGNCFP